MEGGGVPPSIGKSDLHGKMVHRVGMRPAGLAAGSEGYREAECAAVLEGDLGSRSG